MNIRRTLSFLGTILAGSFIALYFIIQPVDVIDSLKLAGYAATSTFVLYILWAKFIWKLDFIKHLHNVPIINGIWVNDVPVYDQDGELITITMRIKQNFDSVKVVLKTNQYSSKSKMCMIERSSEGHYLYFVYITAPNKKYYTVHDIHYGTMRLHCSDLSLKGMYFNSHGQCQEINFSLKKALESKDRQS